MPVLVFDREAQESLKDGVWREYEGGIKTRLRPFNVEVQRKLRKEAQKDGRFDQDLYDRLFWDYLIAEWNVPEVIGKQDGRVVETRPMPCTVENKLLVVEAWQGYRIWVTSKADTLGEEISQITQGQLGNSGGSPAGKRTGHETETSTSHVQAAG